MIRERALRLELDAAARCFERAIESGDIVWVAEAVHVSSRVDDRHIGIARREHAIERNEPFQLVARACKGLSVEQTKGLTGVDQRAVACITTVIGELLDAIMRPDDAEALRDGRSEVE